MSEQGGSVWDQVVGQDRAVAQLRAAADRGPVHAYLFVGPSGSTKLPAARAFAAHLISGGDDADQRDARLILLGTHPDVREIRRAGPSISAEQAREIVRLSSLAPTEGDRKVLILDEFHLLRPEGAALMLKTIEEPPPSTMFLILCDFVPNDLITISSRCVRIDFRAIGTDVITERLVAEGVDPAAAATAAIASLGDIGRARVLASDERLAERRAAFAHVPHQLNGTGSVAVRTAADAAGDDRRRGRAADRAPRAWRSPRSTSRSRGTARRAADASSWRSATSANSVVTAPTSCGPDWRRWPRRTATASPRRGSIADVDECARAIRRDPRRTGITRAEPERTTPRREPALVAPRRPRRRADSAPASPVPDERERGPSRFAADSDARWCRSRGRRPSRAIATMPSSHQWLPLADTASIVSTTWRPNTHRHLLGLAAMMPNDTTAAQATWIDGIAANWSDTPVPTGP